MGSEEASVAWMECKRNPGWDDAERLYSRPCHSHPEYYGAPCGSGLGYPRADITIRELTPLLARNSVSCLIDAMVKQRIAHVVRNHYRTYPEALTMQASGGMTHPEGF